MVKAVWTKEVDENVRKLIKSGETVTLNMFKEVAPNVSITTLGARIKKVGFEMGYNIERLHSKDHNIPIIITKFDFEGDIKDTRKWTEEDDKELLNIVSGLSEATLRDLIEKFNMSSITISKELTRVCRENDIKIRGLGTKVPIGVNRLDCPIKFEFSDRIVKGINIQEAMKATGIKRHKVIIQSSNGVKQIVTMRAENETKAMSKAESMFKGSKALGIKR